MLDYIIKFLFFAFCSSCLSLFFYNTLQSGGIFRKWYLFLILLRWKSCYGKLFFHKPTVKSEYWENLDNSKNYWVSTRKNKKSKLLHNFVVYITKPLGLCLYCNSVWISFFVYVYEFDAFRIINLFLFIGVTSFLTKKLYSYE